MRRAALLAAVLGTTLAGGRLSVAAPVFADHPTVSVDQLRTGWDPAEPNLTPASTGGANQSQAPMGDGHTVSAGTNLADAVIRFSVAADGITITPTNYFSQATLDTSDADLGSSGLSALPAQMGIAGHPHLGVVGGKFGTLYVLDRDNLGGRQTGDAGVVSTLTGTDDLFGHVASWPGDGGFVYDDGTGHLNAFRLNGAGVLNLAGSASVAATSGSPLVTSNGTQAGSATVWIYEHGSLQLRAYRAVPSGGSLSQIFSATVGSTGDAHFNEVAADAGRLLVATDNGLYAFGVAGLPPVPCNCTNHGRNPNDAQGYWEVAADGGIFPWGNAGGFGSTGGMHLNRPIVGMASTPSHQGYYLVASDGGLFPFGDALSQSYGSTGGMHLNRPIVGMAVNPHGGGYWLVASDGGVFPFGPAAGGFGSMGGSHLNQPIVGMAATADGGGYYLVAADSGIFPFGDALGQSYGSTGGMHLNSPIVGMATPPAGGGYWLVAADGGIFPFGPGAGGFGSAGGMRLNQPMVGTSVTRDGGGYWLVARDGGIFTFGDAIGYGSMANAPLNQPMVGIGTS